MSDSTTMRCAYCNRYKNWRDGFPNRYTAECWQCASDRHFKAEHKPRKRWFRRAASSLPVREEKK